MDTLGPRIKSQRIALGLTQEELASKLDVARATIASWESGRRAPDAGTLKKIAKHLCVTVDYLLDSDPDPESWRDVEPEPNEANAVILDALKARGMIIVPDEAWKPESFSALLLGMLQSWELEHVLKRIRPDSPLRAQLLARMEEKREEETESILESLPWVSRLNDDLRQRIIDMFLEFPDEAPFLLSLGDSSPSAFDLGTLSDDALNAVALLLLKVYRYAVRHERSRRDLLDAPLAVKIIHSSSPAYAAALQEAAEHEAPGLPEVPQDLGPLLEAINTLTPRQRDAIVHFGRVIQALDPDIAERDAIRKGLQENED